MFTHPHFERRSPDQQSQKSIWIMNEKYMTRVEREWLKTFDDIETGNPYGVGTVSDAVVDDITTQMLNLTYYLNTHTRYHSIKISIPRSEIVDWIGIYWNYDHKYDYVFVTQAWHDMFWKGQISTFLLVDAIGMKRKISQENPKIIREQLESLSGEIDLLAKKYPNLLFVSAADNVIVKANFFCRQKEPHYAPELLVQVFGEIQTAIKSTIKCDSYGIFTQGFNLYNSGSIKSRSSRGNHINTRSLGYPYKELFDINACVQKDIKESIISPASSYFSKDYLRSLRTDWSRLDINSICENSQSGYVAIDIEKIISSLQSE